MLSMAGGLVSQRDNRGATNSQEASRYQVVGERSEVVVTSQEGR